MRKPTLPLKQYPTNIIRKKIGLNPAGPGIAFSRKRNPALMAISTPNNAIILLSIREDCASNIMIDRHNKIIRLTMMGKVD
jgi:hypothetical protein